MKPLPYVWPYALFFWSLFLWAFAPDLGIVQRARRTQAATDSSSLQVLVVGQGLAFVVAFPLAQVPAVQFPPAYRFAVFYLGVAMLVAGALLRRHCLRMLGASFTGDVRARADQQVVDRGAYRLVRHPAYTAGIVMTTGVGLALGSWASALILAVTSISTYVYRMNVEEQMLASVIGEPYRAFMKTRKRLIPHVY